MSIERVYDKATKHYNQNISAEVLDDSNNCAFNLAQKSCTDLDSILVLGVGSGDFMLPYRKAYPKAILTALDISSKMLSEAKKKLQCQTVHGQIEQASQLLQNKQFNLIVAHFVCAYVTPSVILDESCKLLDKGAHLSLVSNTQNSFPHLMNTYRQYIENKRWGYKTLKKHVERSLQTVYVPASMDEFIAKVEEKGFATVEQKILSLPVSFNSVSEFYDFFMNAGWFANGLVHPFVSTRLIKFMFKVLVNKFIQFPFNDTLGVALLMARRM